MVLLVIRAANLLHVDEYEVFRLAHRFWHRHCDEPKSIRTAFHKYLKSKTAPPWVVHYSRRVVQAYQHGNFDPVSFGVYPAYEKLPLTWSLAFQTSRYVALRKNCDVFVA